jgi:hypothetical protein
MQALSKLLPSKPSPLE